MRLSRLFQNLSSCEVRYAIQSAFSYLLRNPPSFSVAGCPGGRPSLLSGGGLFRAWSYVSPAACESRSSNFPLRVDHLKALSEADEGNNAQAIPITISPHGARSIEIEAEKFSRSFRFWSNRAAPGDWCGGRVAP